MGVGLQAGPVDKAYQKQGVAASRVHEVVVRGGGWGWLREDKGSAPDEVQLPEGPRPADGPPSLGAKGLVDAGAGGSGCASAGDGVASR